MNDVTKFAQTSIKDLMKVFAKASSRRLLRSLKTNKVICAKGYFSLLGKKSLAIKHPDPLYGKLNSPIRVTVKTKDGHGYEQKLEKLKIAVKKGLVKTA